MLTGGGICYCDQSCHDECCDDIEQIGCSGKFIRVALAIILQGGVTSKALYLLEEIHYCSCYALYAHFSKSTGVGLSWLRQ